MPRSERAASQFDDDALQCFPLTFMDGDGPRQLQRKLGVGAQCFFNNLFVDFAELIADGFPLFRLHVVGSFTDFDGNAVAFHILHDADGAVDPTAFTIVFDEHHLRAVFQHQLLRRGKARTIEPEVAFAFARVDA